MGLRNLFALKSSSKKFSTRVVDGEFNTMMRYINSDLSPNMFLMHYSDAEWIIKNLMIIPRYFITSSIIEKRNPLSDDARRKGWIGCNILLARIPESGKIPIIKEENIIDKKDSE